MICGHFHTHQEILGRHFLRSDVNDATLDLEFCIFRMEIYSLYYLKEWIKGRSLMTPLFKGGLSDGVVNHSYRPATNVLASSEYNFASTRRLSKKNEVNH